MNEKMTKFYEAVSADEALKEELDKAVSGAALDAEEPTRSTVADAIAAFAAARDLNLTAADVLAADAEAAEGELSDEELAAVAGGVSCGCFIVGAAKGCGCFFGGKGGNNMGYVPSLGNKCIGMGGINME